MITIQPYMLAALGAVLFSATSFLITKHVLKNVLEDVFVFIFYFNLFAGLAGMLLWLKVSFSFPSPATMGIIFVLCLLAFIGLIFNYLAFHKGDISSTGPLMGLKIPFVAIVSYLLLGERHGGLVYLGVFLSMVSVALLSWEHRKGVKAKPAIGIPVLFMTMATMLYALSDTLSRVVLREIDSWNFSSYFLVVNALFSLSLYPFIRNRPEMKLTLRTGVYLLGIAFLALGLTVFFYLSVKMGDNITVPNILLSSRGVLVVLATFVLSHLAKNPVLESQNRRTYAIRFVGAVLMSVAVALVIKKP